MPALPLIALRMFRSLILLAALLLSACVTAEKRPDLARLYQSASNAPDQPPVILIHGLMGSTLVDKETGKEFWPGSLGALAFSDYRGLAQMSSEDREGEGLVPGDLFYGVAGVDFYSALLDALERVGRFRRGQPGEPVRGADDRRRYYVFLYDWRKDNTETARKLHALIEQIRADYGDPSLRVDLIAHSNGGLIANYYLRYGPRDVLAEAEPQPWPEGPQRVRRLVMLGTPNLGSVKSVERLLYGMRIGLRVIPVEVMATIATPFEALPHPWLHPIVNAQGEAVALDLYDPDEWRRRQWSVYSPEVIARVRESAATPEAGDAAVAELQAAFVRHLARARRFLLALSRPLPAGVDAAVFGGDCELTAARALLVENGLGSELIFRPAETARSRLGRNELPDRAAAGIDYESLLTEPGDGLVTRTSQLARAPGPNGDPGPDFQFFRNPQTVFLCESHNVLTSNPNFQDNLLYFLLAR